MSIEDKVKEIIATSLAVPDEKVTPQASFVGDLGADELDMVELIMYLEDEFGYAIPDTDAEKISTVSDMIDYVKSRNAKEEVKG